MYDINDVVCKISLNDYFILCCNGGTTRKFLGKESLSFFKVDVCGGKSSGHVSIVREDLKLSNVNRGTKQILTKCCQATHPGNIFFLSSWDFCYCDFLRNRLLFLSDLSSSTLKRTNKINLSHLLMVALHLDTTYPFAPIHFCCCFM